MTLPFGNMTVNLNIFNVIKGMGDEEDMCEINMVDSVVQKYLDNVSHDDPLKLCLVSPSWDKEVTTLESEFLHSVIEHAEVLEINGWAPKFEPLPPNEDKALHSEERPPKLELKPLPTHLKYAFLREEETFPVIISTSLDLTQEQQLLEILKTHRTAIGWTIADIKGISPLICTHRIHLEEDVKPSRQPQRRLNPIMKEVVKKEVLKLLDVGVIYPITDSKWVSPTQVVPKKFGVTVVANDNNELIPTRVTSGWRVCIDYRKLNAGTRKDHFPLPFVDQMLERVAGHEFYCFLDGYSGYNQIDIDLEDQEKTTFTCPFGTFAFRKMPFRLCNAPGTFQRCMMGIFSDMIEIILEIFMDDFSVFGDSFENCLENLRKVLKRCQEKNLVLNWEKCHFMVTQGIVFGHIVSKNGIEVDKAKVELISNLPTPKCVRDIRSFLGHAGFYRRFIKDFSAIARPLCTLLAKDVPFTWSQACDIAFTKLKNMLVSPPIMRSPNWDLPFEIKCDTSDYAIGAVLGQMEDKKAFVIYYASKTLDSAQANYTTTKKEFLAVVFALEKFRSYIVGSPVTIFTDHAALKYLLSKQDTKPRLTRWILLCQEFNLTIKNKKGVENVVADHLSRLVPYSNFHGIPIGDSFPDEQLFALVHCPWYADIVNYLVTGQIPAPWTSQQKKKFLTDIKKYYFDDPYLFKYCPDQIMRRCVPNDEQIRILTFCHSKACGGHFSARKMANKILQAGFYWPTLFKDCFDFYKTCAQCQQLGGVTK